MALHFNVFQIPSFEFDSEQFHRIILNTQTQVGDGIAVAGVATGNVLVGLSTGQVRKQTVCSDHKIWRTDKGESLKKPEY